MNDKLLARAGAVSIAVFDVDGVMTDGRLLLDDRGTETKAFHTRDGLGIKALMRHGIEVAVLTARQSELVTRRMDELGIRHLIQGREDKAGAMAELLSGLDRTPAEACYTGDDLVDWPAMRDCVLKCAPADASEWIRQRADFVTSLPGGHGAVREVCELILAGHGHLADWQDSFA